MAKRIIFVIILLLCLGLGIWLWARKPQTVQVKDDSPILSIQSVNQTSNTDPNRSQVSSGDVLAFVLTVENPSSQTIPGYVMQVDISDLVVSATLVDSGGAAYNSTDRTLSWTPLDIPAGGTIEQRFTARVNQVPANVTDKVITLTFNNEIRIGVSGKVAGITTPSQAASPTPYNAPTTGPNENLVVLLALLTTGLWFARSKLGITRG